MFYIDLDLSSSLYVRYSSILTFCNIKKIGKLLNVLLFIVLYFSPLNGDFSGV